MNVNNTPDTMTSPAQVLKALRRNNICNEFRFDGTGLSIDDERYFGSQDVSIVRTYRFEGISNPDDEEVIYVLQANDGTMGYLHTAYGTYADQSDVFATFLRQIPEMAHESALQFEL
jgi:hypothetical protein